MKLHRNLLQAVLALGMAMSVASAQTGASGSPSTTPSTTTGSQTGSQSGSSSAQPMPSTTQGGNMSGPRTASAPAADQGSAMVGEFEKMFLTKAAQGGAFEVQAAQAAQQKGSSDAVKQLAKKIEDDHSKANDELKSLAQSKGFSVPAEVDPKHQEQLTKMQSLSGADFDKAYLKAMRQDHKKDIKEFTRASEKSVDSDVKAFAAKTLPVLQAHAGEVETTMASMKGDTGTRSRQMDDSTSPTTSPSTVPSTGPGTSSPGMGPGSSNPGAVPPTGSAPQSPTPNPR